jgi:hypothetical protein
MPAPELVHDLVERFEKKLSACHSAAYKEQQLKNEFLEPLFECLGWDVRNAQGLPESYKEVVHEYTLQGEEDNARGVPDYTFSIGGKRKFFVEAKKPSVPIKLDRKPALQLRSYAWSAKLSLSVLTNFEHLAVYNCRLEPQERHQADTARALLIGYKDYVARWDEIARIISRDAVVYGSFDNYVASLSDRDVPEVGKSFLRVIEDWRRLLANDLAQRNPSLDEEALKFAVARIIDRIIFLRVCEARGLESEKHLLKAIRGAGTESRYPLLVKLFKQADKRYNSGLFYFKKQAGRAESPDDLTPGLDVGQNEIDSIISTLYREYGYNFTALSPDIFGQIYEQYLGQVIVLRDGRGADVVPKPELKKAEGVYYTPEFIVDYIVRHTIGDALEGKLPSDMSDFAVLDPACGSGSFLLAAYQCLLNWYRDCYVAEAASSGKRVNLSRWPIYQTAGGNWRLTLDERKRILKTHIHGVDIDSQAVEVTKLSLLMRVIEGEELDALESGILHGDPALPDLGDNIKCGDSLLDFSFDYREQFENVSRRGGFDAVIGNPPYVRQEILGREFKDYAKTEFEVYSGVADLYAYFIEKSHRLLKKGGLFGMICSNKWMRANYGAPLRRYLAAQVTLRQVVDFGELKVFEQAATFPAIVLTENTPCQQQHFVYAPVKRLNFLSLDQEVETIGQNLDERAASGDNWTLSVAGEMNVFDKMKRVGTPLGEYVKEQIYWGIKTGMNDAFVVDRSVRDLLISEDRKSKELIKPLIVGDDVRKYHIDFVERYVIFTRHGTDITHYPAIKRHLQGFKKQLEPRPADVETADWPGRKPGPYKWFEIQDNVAYYEEFGKHKIVYPEIAKEPRFAFDTKGRCSNNKTFFIPTDDLYLLGLLNSKLCWAFLKRLCSVLGDADKAGRLELRRVHLVNLPIRKVAKSDAKAKALHDRIVSRVEKILELNEKLAAASFDHEKTPLETQIKKIDGEIDQLVYELYGLTEEEIKIVEASVAGPDSGGAKKTR